MRRLAFVVVSMSVLVGSATARATSGYVRDPGGSYLKLFYSRFASSTYYALDGEKRVGQQLRQQGLTLYTELGLIPHLQVAASIPALRDNTYANTTNAIGFGDLAIEIKTGTTWGEWHAAFAVTPEIPTGRSKAFVNVDGGGQINLPTGDGELNVWSRVALSRGISALNGYASADIGYNVRTKNFHDQYGFDLELGHHLLNFAWLSARLRGQFTVGSKANPGAPFLYGEGTEYLAFDVSAAVPIFKALFATFDYTNIAAARRNVYGGSLFSLGIGAAL